MFFDHIITNGSDASGQVFLTKHISKLVLGHQFISGGLELTDLDFRSDEGSIHPVAFVHVELIIEVRSLVCEDADPGFQYENGPLEFYLVDTFSLTFGF